MLHRLRPRSIYDVMAALAFFAAAAGGTAYAAATIGSGDIKNNAVLSRHIKDGAVTGPDIAAGAVGRSKLAHGAVTGAKVADKSLTGADIKLSTLGTVPSAANAGMLGGLAATAFQRRVGQACPTGNAIASIAAAGTVGCTDYRTDAIIGASQRGDALPNSTVFNTNGGLILIIFAGSGFRTTQQGAGFVTLNAIIDGGFYVTSEVFTNETLSHKATVPIEKVVGLNAGQHTLDMNLTSGTVNGDDRIDLQILQLPQ